MITDIFSPRGADQLPISWSQSQRSPEVPSSLDHPVIPSCHTQVPVPATPTKDSRVIPLLPQPVKSSMPNPLIPAPTLGVLGWNFHKLNVWWTISELVNGEWGMSETQRHFHPLSFAQPFSLLTGFLKVLSQRLRHQISTAEVLKSKQMSSRWGISVSHWGTLKYFHWSSASQPFLKREYSLKHLWRLLESQIPEKSSPNCSNNTGIVYLATFLNRKEDLIFKTKTQ